MGRSYSKIYSICVCLGFRIRIGKNPQEKYILTTVQYWLKYQWPICSIFLVVNFSGLVWLLQKKKINLKDIFKISEGTRRIWRGKYNFNHVGWKRKLMVHLVAQLGHSSQNDVRITFLPLELIIPQKKLNVS